MKTIHAMKSALTHKKENGQALILIAMGFIMLAAFIGLAIDAGILYTYIGHLRRATDSAALSAATQYRENTSNEEILLSARELIALNLPGTDVFDNTQVVVQTCEDDSTLCDIGWRKFVRVYATTTVPLAFMPIIGIDNIDIQADAIAEAASLDLVLVIDTSTSMTYDAACDNGEDDDGDGVIDDCDDGGAVPTNGAEADDYYRDPANCNIPGAYSESDDLCHPFKEVRDAAVDLVESVKFPYDRVALITYDRLAYHKLNLSTCASGTAAQQEACVVDALEAMRVAEKFAMGSTDPYCPDLGSTGDPRGCMGTNVAGGLELAWDVLSGEGRDEAVWVVVLLSDGAANAAIRNGDPTSDPGLESPPNYDDWICPEDTWEDWTDAGGGPPNNDNNPYCNDGRVSPFHSSGSGDYDADDAARDWAQHLGCLDADSPVQYCSNPGMGAVIFSVGLGNAVINYPDGAGDPDTDSDLGAQLLRYVANVGWDGDPNNDPCSGAPNPSDDCGNYFYAAEGSELSTIFQAIADRIFTRLTH